MRNRLNCSRVRKLLSVFIILLMMVNLVSCSTSKTSGFIVLNDYVKFDTTRNRRMVLNVLSNASNPDVSIASIDGDGIENAEYKWSFDNEPIAKYESYSAYMLLLDFDIDEGCVVSIKSIELTLNGTKKTVTFANPVIFRSRVGSLDEKVAEVLEINPVAFAMHSDKVGEVYPIKFVAQKDLTIVDVSPNSYLTAVPLRYDLNGNEHDNADGLFPLKLSQGDECTVFLTFKQKDGVSVYDNVSCDLEVKYAVDEPSVTHTKVVSVECTNDVNSEYIKMVLEKTNGRNIKTK